jgi:transcriptional regulator
MHPNPAFREEDQARALVTARERGFGVLTVVGPEGTAGTGGSVLASHVPFVLDATTVGAHLSRGGAVARHLRQGPAEALLIVSGPDAYISPDWYGVEDQVPTWNYVAVHLRGTVRLLPEERLRPHLERLSAEHEGRLAPKLPWKIDKMSPGVAERMMRQIVPLEMTIASVESTFKLNQNKTEAVRLAAADAVEHSSYANGAAELARLMRAPKES